MELIITNDDGSTTKFTEDMAISAIKERDLLRIGNNKSWDKIVEIRRLVFGFFNDNFEPSTDTDITVSVSDVNQLLKDIGADILKQLYTVRGTINFTITDVEAEDKEDAQDNVENYVRAEWDGEGSMDWEIEVDSVREQ